jgi:hypothetical protein
MLLCVHKMVCIHILNFLLDACVILSCHTFSLMGFKLFCLVSSGYATFWD